MEYCDCGPANREAIRTVSWQQDVCSTCGYPIEGTSTEPRNSQS